MFALGSPKAWLGIAYHDVLEKILRADFESESFNSTVESLWNQAIAVQYQRARSHPLNRRFGPPETWPCYYVARASVQQRADELVASASPERAHRHGPAAFPPNTMREHALTACHGKLVGRPDVVRNGEILDYKAGDIYERGEGPTSTTLKASYVRQLRVYGFLASSALSVSVRRGVLYPMAGQPVEVELDQSDCEREAEAAVILLDRYNNLVAAAASPQDIASPSPDTCYHCPFQVICPALWSAVNDTWFGKLDGELVQGPVLEAPKQLLGGEAFTLALLVQTGTVKPGGLELSPLTIEKHPDIRTLNAGESIRITELGRRLDSSVFPSKRTILIEESKLPGIKTATANEKVMQSATTKSCLD